MKSFSRLVSNYRRYDDVLAACDRNGIKGNEEEGILYRLLNFLLC